MTISNQASGIRPGVCSSTTRPTAPFTGQIIYETDTGYLRVWDGANWDYLSQKQDTAQGFPAGNKMGLELITTLTANGSATSAFVDSVFTSSFDNYFIVADFTSAAASAALLFRMRSSGTDNSGAEYYDRGTQNTTGSVNAVNNLAQTSGFFGASTQNEYAHAEMTLFYPQKVNRRTSWNLASHDAWNVQYYNTMGIVASSTAFDGIKFISNSGVLTGTFRFYGIRQA